MFEIIVVYNLVGIIFCIFFGILATSSIIERKPRAAAISLIIILMFGVFWFGLYLIHTSIYILVILLILVLSIAFLYFLPTGALNILHIDGVSAAVDERDVIFAREEYEPGTEKYLQYYQMHPEMQAMDDRIRALPELLEPGGRYYDPVRSRQIDSLFDVICDMRIDVDGDIDQDKIEIDPPYITHQIKNKVLRLGASQVGVTTLNPMFVYSHVGRGPETWGTAIHNTHTYAIVFTLEMDYGQVEGAPGLSITEESAFQYLQGSQISISIAKYIRRLGYPARAHIPGSNYQIMLPPVAHDAGLDELGRLGYLISPKHGARIRLGSVTTDLPLVTDKRISFGVQDFCSSCRKCANNCPAGAIPNGEKTMVRGVEKWPLNVEKCIQYWRTIGTDCGICMKVCPFSHPPTLVHNIVRAGIKQSSIARQASVWGDDLFYGKTTRFDT